MAHVLEMRHEETDENPPLYVVCPGYEMKVWRGEDLASDVFKRHLTSFALRFSEFQSINGDTAGAAISRAAKKVYASDKYKSRGEFGELILHGVLRDFFGAIPAVSKIYYKDSDNDTVKGFDSVHIVESGDEIEIWLGESKFYQDLGKAIRDVTAEITDHLDRDFLRREFVAITSKLDDAWPHSARLTAMLDEGLSLDRIATSLVMPVFLTYDSDAVSDWDAVCRGYVEQVAEEAESARRTLRGRLSMPLPVRVRFILLPLKSKSDFVLLLHERLKAWQVV